MSLLWLFRYADRMHPLVLPGMVMLISGATFASLASFTQDGLVRDVLAQRQYAGTLVLFSILPGYLLWMMSLQRRRTLQVLAAFESVAGTREIRLVHDRLDGLQPFALAGVLVGIVYGAQQNLTFIQSMYQEVTLKPMDIAFICGNCLVWGTVALMLCWRLPVSVALSRLGETMTLDLYRLDRLKPMARVATMDILVVAGAMVLMPLQSLDAEFRMGNYESGVIVGVPSAVILFLLPLWGMHKNIKQAKAQRLQALRGTLDEVDRQDVTNMETLTAHIERVRAMPNWPIDLQTVTRVFAYVIIPPLAWVGAALVENLVNRV